MRVLIQRVSRASVTVGDELVGAIGPGLLLLVGIGHGDGPERVDGLAEKVVNLRLFEDDDGKMNRSALDLHGAGPDDPGEPPVGVLVVSQFTLYGDLRRGRRPSFAGAAAPDLAAPLVDRFAAGIAAHGLPVATGRFGADMRVASVNDGPVTLWLDSDDLGPGGGD
ncbi:MAG: D-aminoacyl-tRNA deacylase [Thermomicrobiales bacterium]